MDEFYQQYPAYLQETGEQTEFGSDTTLHIFPETILGEQELESTHTIMITDGVDESPTGFVLPFTIRGEGGIQWEVFLHDEHRMIVAEYGQILKQVRDYYRDVAESPLTVI